MSELTLKKITFRKTSSEAGFSSVHVRCKQEQFACLTFKKALRAKRILKMLVSVFWQVLRPQRSTRNRPLGTSFVLSCFLWHGFDKVSKHRFLFPLSFQLSFSRNPWGLKRVTRVHSFRIFSANWLVECFSAKYHIWKPLSLLLFQIWYLANWILRSLFPSTQEAVTRFNSYGFLVLVNNYF